MMRGLMIAERGGHALLQTSAVAGGCVGPKALVGGGLLQTASLRTCRSQMGLVRQQTHAKQPRTGGRFNSSTTHTAAAPPVVTKTTAAEAASSASVGSSTVSGAAAVRTASKARSGGYLVTRARRIVKCLRTKQQQAVDAPSVLKDAAKKVETVAEAAAAGKAKEKLNMSTLMLRFSNENSYLNWARNGVLSSGVGVAMYAQEHHRGAQLSGAGLLLLGFGYIGVGTAKYVYYILRFRHVMELSWGSVIGTITHASVALMIWLTATASFLESVPLELDALMLTEPIASYLPFRIRQGLIETYSLYLDDLEHHNDEQERVLRAIRGERGELEVVEVAPSDEEE